MATVASESKRYPTTDKKPMAETDLHRDLMVVLIQRLESWFEADQAVYVSGNLLLFYERGNGKKHISPDVFVVKGVAKHQRDNYLTWEEGKGPDFVIEVTSSSTRKKDVKKKFELYRDVLKVPEYFLFDPRGDYLKPSLQGYRLVDGAYQTIPADRGRLRSEELGLDLIRREADLGLYDPVSKRWLLSPREDLPQQILARLRAEEEKRHAEQARLEAEQARLEAEQARLAAERSRLEAERAQWAAEKARQEEALARKRAEAEAEELRRQLEAQRRGTT